MLWVIWYGIDDQLAAWSGWPWVGHLPLGLWGTMAGLEIGVRFAVAIIKRLTDD